jgi:Uma2 family endonuclease
MAIQRTVETASQPATDPPAGPQPRLFTVDEYYKMAEAGILRPEERVELIEGVVVTMSPIGDPHVIAVVRLTRIFGSRLLTQVDISVQNPVRLGPQIDPEPDIAVIRRGEADPQPGRFNYPATGDVVLLVEVSESSLEYDTGEKAHLYARHGLPELWVLDLTGDRLIVHRDPTPDGYANVRVLARGESISPLAFEEITFMADEILG